MFDELIPAMFAVLTFGPVLAMMCGLAIGMCVGALPGLSAPMGVALAIPFTYGMEPLTALGLLAGIHNGASQGGAIPAILLNIPGTTGAIATCWDGYPMAQKGQAGSAIRLSAASSAVGGMLSALSLILLAPPLAEVALMFGPPEVFWVNVFGLTAIAALIGSDPLKGIIGAALGMLIAMVGLDNVTGHDRYSFGILELSNGIPELVVMVGMFSLPPTLELARSASFGDISKTVMVATKGVWSVAQVWRVWLSSSLIGIIIGIIPGSGGGSSFIAYTEARRMSKHPETFGKGNPEGVAASEAVNNADNAAAMIPTLTLGVPGGSVAALMLGALLVHGFQPGPQLFRDNPIIVYGYAWQMFFTAALTVVFGGIVASRIFAYVLRVPPVLLLPMIVCMMVAGTFAFQNMMFNVYLMMVFGVLGVLLARCGIPIAPLVIGLVLGGKAEFDLRVSLLIARGDPAYLFTRPISLVIIGLTVLLLIYAFKSHRRDRERRLEEEAGIVG